MSNKITMQKPIAYASAVFILLLGFAISVVIVRNGNFEFTSEWFNVLSKNKVEQAVGNYNSELTEKDEIINNLNEQLSASKGAANELYRINRMFCSGRAQDQGGVCNQADTIIAAVNSGQDMSEIIEANRVHVQQTQSQIQQQLQLSYH